MNDSKSNSRKHGIAKFFRNADASWPLCIFGLIGGLVLSDFSLVLCNGVGFTEIYKNGDVVLHNPVFWIGMGLNLIFNVVFYLSLTCIVSKINPPVRRYGVFMKLLAVLSWIMVCFVYVVFRCVCAELFGGKNHLSIWSFLFLYECCRGLWRWIVGVRVSTSVHKDEIAVINDHIDVASRPASKSITKLPGATGNSRIVFLCIGVVVGIIIGMMFKSIDATTDRVNAPDLKKKAECVNDGMQKVTFGTTGRMADSPDRANAAAVAGHTGRLKPTYSDEEMLDNLTRGVEYSRDELNAMTDEQYKHYSTLGKQYYEAHPTQEMKNERRDSQLKMLELSDELAKKADYIVEQTDGDEEYKSVHDEMVKASQFLKNSTLKDATPNEVTVIQNDINAKYEAALQRRSRWQKTKDEIKGVFR